MLSLAVFISIIIIVDYVIFRRYELLFLVLCGRFLIN